MLIARYRNERDNAPKVEDLLWSDLVSLLTRHERTPCDPCPGKDCAHKRGPAWSPVEIEGGRRLNANVRRIHAIVFDVDHVSLSDVAALAARLDAAGLAAVIHSSHSHLPPNDCAIRVVLRPSRPCLPSEWPHLRAALEAQLGIPADPKTKDLARLYFLPSSPSKGAAPIAASASGESVDVDAVLGSYVPPAPVQAAPREAVVLPPEPVDMGDLKRKVRALAAHYADSTKDGDSERASLLVKMLKGEPISPEGGRDDALQRLCSVLASNLPREIPREAILELLRESLNRMPGPPPLPSDGKDWHEVAERKLKRAIERRKDFDAERKANSQAVIERLMRESSLADESDEEPKREALGGPQSVESGSGAADPLGALLAGLEAPKDGPPDEKPCKPGGYTFGHLRAWAEEQNTDLLTFQRRWIIQRGRAFYVFVGGRYRAPITREDLLVSLPRDLSRAPVRLVGEDKSGNERALSLDTILGAYATVARDVQASLALQRSFYDPRTETFFEAVRPLRPIRPREHKEIHRWLELLGGKDADKLIAWVATCMRLDRQSCAIYVDGVGGAGKTLLANGLARLWHAGGPSELHRVLDGFNDSLVQCPLLFADESLPAKKGITAELRRLIGSTARSLRRLYMPTCNLDGAVRVIIAGNNDRLLDTGEDLSANDLEAVAGRFLYLKADRPAADFLRQLGGPPVVGRWITHDLLAEHALFLRDTWPVVEGARFLVEGETSEFHANLATGSGIAGLVCEWLARHLSDPTTARPLANGQVPLVLTGEGELWVATDALAADEAWTKRVPSQKVPTATKIGKTLRNLSHSSERLRVGDQQRTFHRVKPELLLSWVERSHVGDPEELRRRVSASNPVIAQAKASRLTSAA
jgi:hypothetical protein